MEECLMANGPSEFLLTEEMGEAYRTDVFNVSFAEVEMTL